MNISIKPPELTGEKFQQLKNFYSQTLQQGYSRWPLYDGEMVIWVDGKARIVKRNSYATLIDYVVYLADSQTASDSTLDDTQYLAIILALMSQTGHASDPELQALVEQKLAKILMGTYQAAVAPLGQRPDGRPVESIAWSADGGLAALIEGEWLRPVTGEPVQIGEGWVVLDVAKEEAAPAVAEGVSETGANNPHQRIEDFARREGYSMGQVQDVYGIPFASFESANRALDQAVDAGLLFRISILGQGGPQTWMVIDPIANDNEPIPF